MCLRGQLVEDVSGVHGAAHKLERRTCLLCLLDCFIYVSHNTVSLNSDQNTIFLTCFLTHTHTDLYSVETHNQQRRKKKKKQSRHHRSSRKLFCRLLLFTYAVLFAPPHHSGNKPDCSIILIHPHTHTHTGFMHAFSLRHQ